MNAFNAGVEIVIELGSPITPSARWSSREVDVAHRERRDRVTALSRSRSAHTSRRRDRREAMYDRAYLDLQDVEALIAARKFARKKKVAMARRCGVR